MNREPQQESIWCSEIPKPDDRPVDWSCWILLARAKCLGGGIRVVGTYETGAEARDAAEHMSANSKGWVPLAIRFLEFPGLV